MAATMKKLKPNPKHPTSIPGFHLFPSETISNLLTKPAEHENQKISSGCSFRTSADVRGFAESDPAGPHCRHEKILFRSPTETKSEVLVGHSRPGCPSRRLPDARNFGKLPKLYLPRHRTRNASARALPFTSADVRIRDNPQPIAENAAMTDWKRKLAAYLHGSPSKCARHQGAISRPR